MLAVTLWIVTRGRKVNSRQEQRDDTPCRRAWSGAAQVNALKAMVVKVSLTPGSV